MDASQLAAQDVVAKVLAQKGIAAAAPAVAAKPAAVAAPAATPAAAPSGDQTASMEKVKEMANKLGIPFTNDLMSLGSNSAISDALIEKAVAAGKTEEQIQSAMASL